MCGIAGIFQPGQRVDPGRIVHMLNVLEHRGPDGSGTHVDKDIALGHRRLSIIDVSDAGAQPMFDEPGGRWVVTFNGEIYNYLEIRAELQQAGVHFRSESDTEVLVKAWAQWGESCLAKLNGMFAFAIFDTESRQLWCVRDRMGVKPLSYTWDGARLGFASEVKALLAGGLASGECRPDAMYEYLARGYTSGGRSFYAGVEVLEPGHMLHIDEHGSLRVRSWWNPSRAVDESIRSAAEWAERVGELIDDSVRLRLRSDVPVGAHLSGGLDSSAVVAAAARAGASTLETFTGAFVDDRESDEREYSRAVAAMYGLPTREVAMSVDQLADQFARILWHMDEPIAGQGVFPQLLVCDLAAQHGCTVVLGGQGGDELFGGYLRHRALFYKHQLANGSVRARGQAFIELSRRAAGEWKRVLRSSTRVSDDQLAPSFLAAIDSEFRAEVRASRLSHASVRDLMWHDLRTYLPALLHVEDRTSMAASIESRTPLLDYRLVELSLQIPDHLLFAPGEPKPLLRRAVRTWLPPSVADRRDKKGFPTPLQWWTKRPALRGLVMDLTTPGSTSSDSRMWWASSERDAGRTVFADRYLEQRDRFQPSELWTVLTINGWLARLQSGAFSQPIKVAS